MDINRNSAGTSKSKELTEATDGIWDFARSWETSIPKIMVGFLDTRGMA
jgi:hypothetical protein